MKTLRMKIVSTVAFVSLYLCTLMWLFHAFYFLRDPGYLSENAIPFWATVISLIAVVSVILFIRTGYLDRIYRKLRKGEICTEKEIRKARRIMRLIPILIVATNIFGFFLGPIISTIVAAVMRVSPVIPILLVLTIVYNVAIGIISSIQSIYLVNIILMEPRRLFNVHHIADAEKGLGFRAKNMLVSLGSVVSAVTIFLAAGYGFFQEKGAVSPENLAAYQSGQAGDFLFQMVLLAVIVIAILALTIFIVINEQRTQFRFLISCMERVSGGGDSLSERLPIIQNDEFGRLTFGINQFMSGLAELLNNLQRTSEQVGSSSGRLESAAAEAAEAASRVNGSLKNVEDTAERQSEAMEQAEKAIHLILKSIREVSNHVETQATFVEESSAAITEMTANIQNVSSTTKQAKNLSSQLLSVAEEGGKAVYSTVGAIREIEDSSHEVENIVSVISKLAAQTNMLAMNAAIEAAHAGASGRGFAVVADEVRKLAESSSRSTKEITSHIKVMASKIQNGVDLAEQAGEAFKQVVSYIDDTTNLTNTITAAMEEQRYGADEILTSITTLVDATEEIKKLAAAQAQESGEVQKVMDQLVASVGRIRDAVREQGESNSEIGKVIEELRTISRNNSAVVEGLASILDRFKAEDQEDPSA